MARKKYTYREGARFSIPADVAGAELERIRRSHGLSASALLDEARPTTALLHPAFEWNDVAAGEQYRLWQARQLIRSVQVIQSDGEKRSLYVHVTGAQREGTYETIEAVVQHPDRYTLALLELEKKLAAAHEAVEELKAAAAGLGDADKAARISVAIEALRTAGEAVRALH